MIKTRVEIEYDIKLIAKKVTIEYDLEDNWYHDIYELLLVNDYGENMLVKMEQINNENDYQFLLMLIENNYRKAATERRTCLNEIMPARFVYKGEDDRMHCFEVSDIMNFTHPDLKIIGYVEQVYYERLDCMVPRNELAGKPKFEGWLGPFWDDGYIRYETEDVYNAFSM